MTDRPIRSVLSRKSPSDGPISRVHEEKTRRPYCPIRFVWQDDKADASSYGQVASAQPIKRLRSILRTNHKKEFSAQPITSFGWIIFGRTFFGQIILRMNPRLSQSHPSVGLSSDRLSLDGSPLKTELSAQPITSVGRIIFGRTFFGRIILRRNRWLSQSHPSFGLSLDGISS